MTHPEELTLAEKIDLDLYFENYVSVYAHNVVSSYSLGFEPEELEWMADEIAEDAPKHFGSRWSRAWLVENKDWITPEVFEAIERGLEDVPVGSDLDYFKRLDALAETIEGPL
jgi:hypothetical protein